MSTAFSVFKKNACMVKRKVEFILKHAESYLHERRTNAPPHYLDIRFLLSECSLRKQFFAMPFCIYYSMERYPSHRFSLATIFFMVAIIDVKWIGKKCSLNIAHFLLRAWHCTPYSLLQNEYYTQRSLNFSINYDS